MKNLLRKLLPSKQKEIVEYKPVDMTKLQAKMDKARKAKLDRASAYASAVREKRLQEHKLRPIESKRVWPGGASVLTEWKGKGDAETS